MLKGRGETPRNRPRQKDRIREIPGVSRMHLTVTVPQHVQSFHLPVDLKEELQLCGRPESKSEGKRDGERETHQRVCFLPARYINPVGNFADVLVRVGVNGHQSSVWSG